jgi:hypothetical protein
MPELVDVVLDAPVYPGLADEVRSGNEFAILRVFESQKSPFTTKIAG